MILESLDAILTINSNIALMSIIELTYDAERIETLNNPPNKPTARYDQAKDELVVSTTDPDGDKVKYGVSWDNDGNVDKWTELHDSGEESRINCEGRKGTVGVIAEDEYGAQSDWVSVKPKNKPYLNTPFLEQLIQRFSLLVKLLQPVYDKLMNLR